MLRLRRKHLVGMMALSAVGVGATPREAQAITAWTTDCFSVMDKTSFNPGDPVCVTGEMDVIPPEEFICAAGYVAVVPFQSADPWADVTAGGANYILGCAGAGAFFDEYLWLPPLQPGTYEITIDQHPFHFEPGQNDAFGPEDYRTNMSFTVEDAPIVFSVDVAAIKAAAEDGLEYAYAIADLASFLRLVDFLQGAAEFAIEPDLLGGIELLHGILCFQPPCDQPEGQALCGVEGFVVDCDDPLLEQLNKDACPPTSYNSWVIDTGTDIMDGISKALAKHYAGLICDPPDPNFEVTVPLDLSATFDQAAPSFAPAGAGPQPEGQAALNRALATQAAAYQALLPTLEKLQGADEAGSNIGLMLQAEKTIAYGELAQAAGQEMLDAVDLMEADLEANGHLDVVYDVATPLAMMDTEPPPADKAYLYSYGVDDEAITAGQALAGTLEVPPEVSRRALFEAVRGNVEAMDAALTVMVSEAVQVRDENAPYALRLSPLAAVTGPATVGVGESVALSASAEYFNADTVLTYAWDTDLDGAFDDGAEATVEMIPAAPGFALVGVRVSDPEGRADVAYHRLKVSVTNVPPAILSTSPTELAPFAGVGEAVDLAVEAVDQDGDTLSYSWYVDDALVATVPTISFVMPDEEMHVVRVVVSDTNAYTVDAETRFTIRSAKWDGQTGEGGQGGGGGSGAGGGDDGGSSGDGDDDGGGSCDCQTPARSSTSWVGFVAAASVALSRSLRRRGKNVSRKAVS